MLGLQNEREWQVFCAQVLESPELASDPRFSSNARRTQARDELRALIVERFARLSSEQLIARLDAAQIANARMNDMHDVWEHPQLARHAGAGPRSIRPAGPIPALLPPGEVDAFTPRMDAVPALGEHSDAILPAERPRSRPH
jgi:itaconate CoA-transferase